MKATASGNFYGAMTVAFLMLLYPSTMSYARNVIDEIGDVAVSHLPPPAQVAAHFVGGLFRGGHEYKRYRQISKRTEAEGRDIYQQLVRDAENNRAAGGSALKYKLDKQRAQKVQEAYMEEAKQIRRIGREARTEKQIDAERKIFGAVVNSDKANRIFREAKDKLEKARGAIEAARGDLQSAAGRIANTGALGEIGRAAGKADKAAEKIERIIAIAAEVGLRTPAQLERIANDLRRAEQALDTPGRLVGEARERLDRIMEKADEEVARLQDEIEGIQENGLGVERPSSRRTTRPERVSANAEIQDIRKDRQDALDAIETERLLEEKRKNREAWLEQQRKKNEEECDPQVDILCESIPSGNADQIASAGQRANERLETPVGEEQIDDSASTTGGSWGSGYDQTATPEVSNDAESDRSSEDAQQQPASTTISGDTPSLPGDTDKAPNDDSTSQRQPVPGDRADDRNEPRGNGTPPESGAPGKSTPDTPAPPRSPRTGNDTGGTVTNPAEVCAAGWRMVTVFPHSRDDNKELIDARVTLKQIESAQRQQPTATPGYNLGAASVLRQRLTANTAISSARSACGGTPMTDALVRPGFRPASGQLPLRSRSDGSYSCCMIFGVVSEQAPDQRYFMYQRKVSRSR